MSLIGSVGLTNNQNGLYLGQVNVDNADEFALTANSIYVNDNIKTIQSAVNEATQADVIYISSGSFGEVVTITNKYNIGLMAPAVGNQANTICEILNGVIVDGSSELIRLANIQIKGANSQIKGVGRQKLDNIIFTGSSSQTNAVEFGKGSTKFFVVNNCEFDNYCTITIHNTFASVIYFINCNFGGATLSFLQSLPTQVIINNCSGFVSFPVNATYYGLNVLTSGLSTNTINNLKLSNGTMTITNPQYLNIDGVSSSTLIGQDYFLSTNGLTGLKYVQNPPSRLLYFVDCDRGQLSVLNGNPITIFTKTQNNILPSINCIVNFTFNLNISGSSDILTIFIADNNTLANLDSININVENGWNSINGTFKFTSPNDYTLDYSIVASLATHNISTDTDSNYSILFYQNTN